MDYLKLLRSSPGTATVLVLQVVVLIAMRIVPPSAQPAFVVRGVDVLQGRYVGAALSMMAHAAFFHWFCNAYGTFVLGDNAFATSGILRSDVSSSS